VIKAICYWLLHLVYLELVQLRIAVGAVVALLDALQDLLVGLLCVRLAGGGGRSYT